MRAEENNTRARLEDLELARAVQDPERSGDSDHPEDLNRDRHLYLQRLELEVVRDLPHLRLLSHHIKFNNPDHLQHPGNSINLRFRGDQTDEAEWVCYA